MDRFVTLSIGICQHAIQVLSARDKKEVVLASAYGNSPDRTAAPTSRDLNMHREGMPHRSFFLLSFNYIAINPIQGTVVPVYLLACLCFGLAMRLALQPEGQTSAFLYIITLLALLNSTTPPYPTPSQSSHHLRFFSRSASALAASLKSIAFCDGGVLLRP